jgi:CHASE3 domain sensor protein
MKFILMLIIGLAVAGVVLYMFLGQQKMVQQKATESTTSAQDAANAYRENQAKMMKEIQQ